MYKVENLSDFIGCNIDFINNRLEKFSELSEFINLRNNKLFFFFSETKLFEFIKQLDKFSRKALEMGNITPKQ